MTIKETFPLFSSKFESQNQSFWEDELVGVTFYSFIKFVECVFYEKSVEGTDEFHSCAKYLLQDILSPKANPTNEELEVLQFLQFYICVRSASFLSQNGIFTQVHDWLVWSISDKIDYGIEVTFLLERINIFFHSKIPFITHNVTSTYIEWLTTLFYYSRHQGGLKELANLILNQEIHRLSYLPKNYGMDYEESQALNLLCQVLAWSINNQETKGYQLAPLIKGWIPKLEPLNQKLANLQLATGGAQFTDKKPEFYAKEVIDNFSQYCKGHELLHALAIYYTTNLHELESDFDLMDKGFTDYLNSISDLNEDSKKYEKGRIFGIIRGIVMTCLKEGKAKLAFHILSKFYEKTPFYNKHLFLALNINKQICSFILDNIVVLGNELSTDEYRQLIYVSNKFLGTKISLHDDPEFVLEEPKYLGIPDKDLGIDFEKKLSNYYSNHILKDSPIKDFENLVILPGYQHPIQPLMIKELGRSAPINCSFEEPKPSKKIEKVLLWCYGTLSSDRELELISEILQKSGVLVDAVNILEESKESFLKKYNNPEYDIIWIATHGNYDHMIPHKSTLSILPNVEITVKELAISQTEFNNQRLLFLNVCDGATSATHDSLYEHGFGASLASSSQCVISHLWPVETEPALFFGALYSLNISENDFWNSYTKTIGQLCFKGKSALSILTGEFKEIDLKQMEEKLVEGMEKNIYYWGSSVFYN
ncbi:CHAT domain-containing protein [Flavobacterium gyeonganense]|uniref:CHAT domain-containing protein n=1 Tax=Flavobacterium gyeonganense TaxID=1310418 RepID=A0ABV5H6B3_9FLAO|nr:CHAT domain-containing protein [Flavobacterium gyeonganense]